MGTALFAQQKHALVVAVADYPTRTEGRSWTDLSSLNDVKLVKVMLKEQGFEAKNIQILEDAEANTSNVMKAFDDLIAKLKKGDIVYFHYSGHGQQIADLDPATYPNLKYISKDEHDGFDEALALYNAPIDYFEGYDFTGHLIDDQLDYFVTKIETILGTNGHLVCVLDACHSGSGTRGTAPAKRRGSMDKCRPTGYKPERSVEGEQNFSDLNMNSTDGVKAIFMGCRNDEINYEIKVEGVGYGSLTYGFVTAISSLNTMASYKNVSDAIKGQIVSATNGEQTPEFLMDAPNNLIFGGDIVLQPDFIQVTGSEIFENNLVYEVAAGVVHKMNVGDSLAFYKNDTMNINSSLFKGVVVKTDAHVSLVQFNSGAPKIKTTDLPLYKSRRFYETQSGQVLNIAMKIEDKELLKSIKKALKTKSNINLKKVNDSNLDYYLTENESGKVFIELPFSGYRFKGMKAIDASNEDGMDTLVLFLEQALRIDYFQNLNLSDPDIDIDIEIAVASDEKVSELKDKNTAFKDRTIVGLEFKVTNNSDEDIYVYAINIKPNREISLMPLGRDGAKQLRIPLGGMSKYLKSPSNKIRWFACDDGVDCGMEKVYIFMSFDKMNFDVIEKTGKSLASRGAGDSSFVKLIKDGADGTDSSSSSVKGVKLLKYEFELKP